MRSIYTILIMVFILVNINGCVTKQPIRSHLDPSATCRKGNNIFCDKEQFYNLNEKVKIAVLEINDFGIILNKEGAEHILNYIRAAMESDQSKPIVNLYIHGWNHGGTSKDTDLIQFEKANLAMFRTQKGNDNVKREVIGIYVSWRGQTLPTKTLNTIATFWGRKAVSEEVGRGELTSFISRLENIVKPEKIKESTKNGTLILVGHSFGASALYNAIQAELVNRFYESLEAQKHDNNQKIQGFGDMVILLNPAIQALRFTPLREAVYRNANENKDIFKNNLHPNLIVLSTDNDFPVRHLFPLGRNLAELKNYHGKTPIYVGNTKNVEQASLRELNTTAIGQYEQYFTHWATIENKIEIKNGVLDVKECLGSGAKNPDKIEWLKTLVDKNKNSENIADNTYTKFLITNNTKDEEYQLHSKIKWDELHGGKSNVSWKRNPYWFVRVNKDFMDGHNGVWSRNVGCLTLLMLTTDREDAGTQTIFFPVIM
ncbi:hypothetical protein [Acinetobacter dispersus]|uniref:hypothetical protein n=1 Tax=Acinetobacter dispersus TaxID=70348 RepID=UPI001F4B6686|nr:hypothetical protein [Acinetobacter dispersus]MCH7389576.1 hypothetical protein [Acinetobacter dispersus]